MGHWHPSEFKRLLATEGSELGTVYACHGHVKVKDPDRGMCAGWLLDQKKRNLPSIMLRLLLSRDDAALAAFDAVNDGGHPMFKTLTAMCRANGVRRR